MSPWIIGFSVFFGYPLVTAAYLSFNHYDLLSPPRWVGLDNYRYLFQNDPQVGEAVRNTIWMILIAVPLQVCSLRGRPDALARAPRASGRSGRSSTCPRSRRRWRRRSRSCTS